MTDEVLRLVKEAYANKTSGASILKAGVMANALFAENLEKPAKNLYPVTTILRNRIPRTTGGAGDAVKWKQVTNLNSTKREGGVAEGQRGGIIEYDTATKLAAYASLGEDSRTTFEAQHAGKNFEDIRAKDTIRLLQAVMEIEELIILGGLSSTPLADPSMPTTAAVVDATSTLAAGTYRVIVRALTTVGFRNSDKIGFTSLARYTAASPTATQLIAAGERLDVTVPVVPGALAYAWFLSTGVAGTERLEAITTINSARFLTPLLGTGVLNTALSALNITANSLVYDGIIPQVFAGGNIQTLATGTPGVGTPLTSISGAGISQIDISLQRMWDNSQTSPTMILVNSQEARNITSKVIANGGSPIVRINVDSKTGQASMQGGTRVGSYLNQYTGEDTPILIHPFMAPGTVLLGTEKLPNFPMSEVPNVMEIDVRSGYTQYEWAMTQRQWEYGVYAEEVLKLYFLPGFELITNIGNG